MKAKVVKAFPGRPDREALTRTIEVGEEIGGELAAVAVREGWAEEVGETAGNEGDGAHVDLEKMKVGELKDHAAALGVDLGDANTKAEIIAAIATAASPKE